MSNTWAHGAPEHNSEEGVTATKNQIYALWISRGRIIMKREFRDQYSIDNMSK
jgi:hypothetical protein